MFFVKTVSVDTADDSAFQPQGVQEDGNGAALEKGALINGFMIVSVKKDEIVFRKKRLAANAVGDGSAVEDKPCPVCAEGVGCQFSAAPAAPSWEDGLPGSLPESDISAANMAFP